MRVQQKVYRSINQCASYALCLVQLCNLHFRMVHGKTQNVRIDQVNVVIPVNIAEG